jgi:hypothetical protein
MPSGNKPTPASSAILLLAEIKAAIAAFDQGDANAFEVIDDITIAVETYRTVAQPGREAA